MGLFEPNWMSHDVEKALKAVDRIADKSKLLTLSLSPSAHFDVRMRAIKKLKNRVNAIEKMTDQDMLVAIAKDHMRLCPVFTAQERLAAIMKLTDKPLAQKLSQEIYITIATSARYPDHDRLDAAEKILHRKYVLRLSKKTTSDARR